jgi:mycofactocin precursor
MNPENPQQPTGTAPEPITAPADSGLADNLVEEVSIDGMCGVY